MLSLLILHIFIFHQTLSVGVERDLISLRPECKDDIKILMDLCKMDKDDLANNWAVLDCVGSQTGLKKLSDKCDNYIWSIKLEVTKKEVFLEEAKVVCGKDISLCKEEPTSKPGHLLSCLVEKKGETTNTKCKKFLSQLENLIFSDYRLISPFLNKCEEDITKLECGKSQKAPGIVHSQGATVQCLAKKIELVSGGCKKEIFIIAELQSDDYHLDRALFLACKDDREQFCSKVQSGHGEVYKCLIKNKMAVSQNCQQQITRRQMLAVKDYKVNAGLAKGCKEEIKASKCRNPAAGNGNVDTTTTQSQILLCLEHIVANGRSVSGLCISEMRNVRRQLMADYSITPEISLYCAQEIERFCKGTKVLRNGKTIHCLMQSVIDQNQKKISKETISGKCELSLNKLLAETHVSSDWQVDPVLEDACEEVVAALCDPSHGNDAVLSCLMEHMSQGHQAMPTQCSAVLKQIHYFLAREVMVDSNLYKSCKNDAHKVCHESPGWHKTEDDSRHQLVFPCLVRNLYAEDEDEDKDIAVEDELSNHVNRARGEGNAIQLSVECTHAVERTLKQRAMSVNLHPEIEEVCRGFLHTLCTSHVEPGAELECLQDNYRSIDKECQAIVDKYTIIEARNPQLHPVIIGACANLIERKCGQESEVEDGSGVMECLIRHKLEHPQGAQGSMNNKCRTVLEHWQILSLEDWRFSFGFKHACKDDIREHCTDPRPKKKLEVVGCLVAIISKDTLTEEKHRVRKACREEIKFELLQKHSSIKLDPVLEEACNTDLEMLCSKEEQKEDGGLECLKTMKPEDLTIKCRKELFQEEVEEARDNQMDFTLMRGCKREIREHCDDEEPTSILICLKDFSDDSNFAQKCRNIILKRIAQHMKDYRLNPILEKACKKDITKLCGNIIIEYREERSFLEGKIIACLKQKAIQNQEMLTEVCRTEIISSLRDSTHMVEADPVLERTCPKSIAKCRRSQDIDSGAKIYECLREMFKEQRLQDKEECKIQVALIVETVRTDIQLDPILHTACAIDLAKFCRNIEYENGGLFACLVEAYKHQTFSLEQECKTLVSRRLEMLDMAVQVAPHGSAQDIYHGVVGSPTILVIVILFFGVVFGFGMCFGRISKTLKSEEKNR